jgi:hypothetical protein
MHTLNPQCLRHIAEHVTDLDRKGLNVDVDEYLSQDMDSLDSLDRLRVVMFREGARYERRQAAAIPVETVVRYEAPDGVSLKLFRIIVMVFAILTAAVIVMSWRGARSYGLDLAEREAAQVLTEGPK